MSITRQRSLNCGFPVQQQHFTDLHHTAHRLAPAKAPKLHQIDTVFSDSASLGRTTLPIRHLRFAGHSHRLSPTNNRDYAFLRPAQRTRFLLFHVQLNRRSRFTHRCATLSPAAKWQAAGSSFQMCDTHVWISSPCRDLGCCTHPLIS